MRKQVTKHVPWHHWTILDKEPQERNGPDTKLLSRRKLKLCLSQNFYFGQMSSNIGECKTITNMNQLTVWLGLHFAANSSWQAYEGPSLSGLGHPGSLRGFLLSSGWEAGWSHLPLTASRLKSSLLCPVGGTLRSQLSICPCSGAVKRLLALQAWICPLLPPQLIFIHWWGGFHLDQHTGQAAWSLSKDVTLTICLPGF